MFLGPFFLLPLLSMGPTLYLFFIFKINCMRVNSVRACLCFPNQLHLGESAVVCLDLSDKGREGRVRNFLQLIVGCVAS